MTVSVEKPSVRAQISLNINEYTLRRHHISAKIVGKLSVVKAASFGTIEYILGRNLTSVTNVGRALASMQVLVLIRDSTPERSHINVRSVEKPSTTAPILINIIESILGKSPIGVIIVEKRSVVSQIFPNTRESILEREKCFNRQVCSLGDFFVFVFFRTRMLGRSQVIVIKASVVDFVSLNIKGRWRSEGGDIVVGGGPLEALERVVDSALASLTGSGSPHHT